MQGDLLGWLQFNNWFVIEKKKKKWFDIVILIYFDIPPHALTNRGLYNKCISVGSNPEIVWMHPVGVLHTDFTTESSIYSAIVFKVLRIKFV